MVPGSRRRLPLVAVALTAAALAGATPASAGDGANFDPDSASGKEYSLPVDEARRDATDPDRKDDVGTNRLRDPQAESAPLFGEGVEPEQSGGSSGGSDDDDKPKSDDDREESGGGSGSGGSSKPPSSGSSSSDDTTAAVEPGAVARTAREDRDGGSASLSWTIGPPALALMVGAVVVLAMRRRRPPPARPLSEA